ncbi:MAG TPA: nicotinate-nucleotide adenylyltransferase, partial [Rhodothermales bacterium]|nr:nicotinate-nucleotide adenylyltransferase [Rhodothermales bacterium]
MSSVRPRPAPLAPRWGLFGGAFDPPHLGHLIVAETIREVLGLERVVWMVAARPPHKLGRAVTDFEQRLAMVQAAIAGNPGFEVSDLEAQRFEATGQPSYTVDTLRALHAAQPDVRWALLMGEDQYAAFATWRDPNEITRMADLVVYRRTGATAAPEVQAHFAARIVEAGRVDVSSTELRARVREGRSLRYLVPEAVRAYVEAHG